LAFVALFLVLACLGLFEEAAATDDKCNKMCGDFEEVKDANEKVLSNAGSGAGKSRKRRSLIKLDERIVNGYDPKPRGFIVLIRAYENFDKEPDYSFSQSCGGSIINNQHVLTAGHCVCSDIEGLDSLVNNCPNGNVEYDKKILKVFVGVGLKTNVNHDFKDSSNGVTNIDYDTEMKDVEEIYVHPTWQGGKGINEKERVADLAVIKLKEKIEFSNDVKPICLPFGKAHESVFDKKAYVAGWGQSETEVGNCLTDNRGPARNKRCRFPFVFQDPTKPATESLPSQRECQKNTKNFPSNQNGKCEQFNEANPEFDWTEVSYIQIWYNKRSVSTKCFSPDKVKKYGWCGVCLEEAQEGEPGHCVAHEMSHNNHDDRDDEERTVVTMGKNWGYCSPSCEKILSADGEAKKKTLKETQLTIFDPKTCEALQGKDEDGKINNVYNGKQDYCAGLKLPFPKYKVYNREFNGKDSKGKSKYKFNLEATKDDKLMDAKTKSQRELDFYIGFSDSCQGDSGGPLFMFEDKKAYQVGVVSRGGADCGGFNQAGIYGSLNNKENLDWVVENSKSGTCP